MTPGLTTSPRRDGAAGIAAIGWKSRFREMRARTEEPSKRSGAHYPLRPPMSSPTHPQRVLMR